MRAHMRAKQAPRDAAANEKRAAIADRERHVGTRRGSRGVLDSSERTVDKLCTAARQLTARECRRTAIARDSADGAAYEPVTWTGQACSEHEQV